MSRYVERMFREPGSEAVALIIEDDGNLRQNLAYMFEAEKIRTLTAADGMSGLALMWQHRPRVVVLDMYLPHVSGFEILDELRSDSVFDGTFVVAITGMAEDDEDLRSMKGSADLIMGKPLDEHRLVALVHAAMESQRQAVGLRRRQLS